MIILNCDKTYKSLPMKIFSISKIFTHKSMQFLKEHGDDSEMYYRNLSKNRAHPVQSELERNARHFDEANRDVPRRKASINELSEDEIVFAYNKLKAERNPIAVDARNEDLSGEMQKEFLRWMEMKQLNATMAEKVNIIDGSEVRSDVVNVVKSELDEPSQRVVNKATDDAVNTENVDQPTSDDKKNTDDFYEFKDAISDDVEDEDYLKVPLMILEEVDIKNVVDESQEVEKTQEDSLLPTVIESSNDDKIESSNAVDDIEPNTIEAKITLGNAPLEIVTSLSSSNISLASSGDERKQRPAKHSKGRAPPPPTNVIAGHYYDKVTKKHFKETEL